MSIKLITANWQSPPGVRAYSTSRQGGVSLPPWQSLNLGAHCGDDPAHVAENRQRLARAAALPGNPRWLEQVHGCQVVRYTDNADKQTGSENQASHFFASTQAGVVHKADASWTDQPNIVCAVMTADCLPVLFCNRTGTQVAAAHAGWRGLCAGVLENTVASFRDSPQNLLAWLGPAIGPQAFEVGGEVRKAFIARDASAARAFISLHQNDKYLANLYLLARQRLNRCGVSAIYGGDYCTYRQADQFFSWRRDQGHSGRMVSLIWRQ